MAKALKVAGAVVGIAALAIVTGGAALGLGVSLATSIAGIGVSAGTLLLVSAGLSLASAALTKAPTVPQSQTQRLIASIDPRAFRKTVLGQTAMATDIRYEEWSGKDQEYCDWIVCLASHAIDGVEEIWIDQELAWSASRGVSAKFAGYFAVPNIILEGSPANAFTFGAGMWNGFTRLTGCAYLHLRFKTTGNGKKGESPFSSGISTRLTIIGRGAKLYDPRRDSTVPGGSGPMRWNDQSTWRYTADDGAVIGENLALQILRVVLGWRIRNPATGEWRLATGSGVPGRRIGMASFQIAANLCDELVNRSAGGQEPRYHGAGVISEGDDPGTILDALCAACCGRFRDTGGKLELAIAHNDLAAAAADDGLNDDDVVGPFTWDPDPSLETTPNVVRGRYVDATAASLYQLIDFPEVRIPSPDGQDRIATLDLGMVESPSQAQRVARQVLQRKQYQRSFSAPFDIRAWKYGVGDVVPFTFAPLGFTRALFRVADQEQGQGGVCQMTLTVEHQALYAWDANDAAPVMAADPIIYDRGNNPLILAIAEASESALWSGVIDDDGNRPDDGATNSGNPNSPFGPDGTVGGALQRIGKLYSAIEILADTPDPEELLNGAQSLVDGVRAQKVAQLAAQLLGEARKQRTDALTHLDGIPTGAVVRRVDRERQEGDEILAEAIELVKASGEFTNGLLDAEILRIDRALIDGKSATATSIESIRADAQLMVDGVAQRTTGEILRIDKAFADAEQASASAAQEVTARLDTADAERVGAVTRLDQAVATLDSVTATALQQVQANMDDRITGEVTRIDRAFADNTQAQAQSLATTRADFATTVDQEAAKFVAETVRLDSAIVTKDSAQADALATTRAELVQQTEEGRAIASAEIQRLDHAVVDAEGSRAASVEQVRAELSGVAAEVSVQKAAIVDLEGRAKAYLVIEVEAGTGRAVARFQADDIDGSTIDLAANRLRFANPVNGQMITAMHIVGGNVEVVNDLLLGSGRIISRSATHMLVHGTGFGSANQFIEWFGPLKGSLSECTEAQAIRYTKVDGSAYSAGIVAEGQLRQQKTSFDYGLSSVAIGPNVTNGKRRIYVASLVYSLRGTRWSLHNDTNPTTGTFIIERLHPDGSWQLLGAAQLGNYQYESSNNGYGSESEPSLVSKSASGTLEVIDDTGGTEPIQLRARVIALDTGSVTGTAYQADQVSQMLQIVTYEP